MKSKYRIAFVSEYDLNNVRARSGVPFFIKKTLEDIGCEVIDIGNLKDNRPFYKKFIGKFLTFFYNKVMNGRWGIYLHQRSLSYIKNLCTQAEKLLKQVEHDFVFSPDNLVVAFIKSEKPIIFWSDATFNNMLNYYPGGFSNLCKITIQEAHIVEKSAINNCSLAIYTSEWAAKSAVEYYGLADYKVRIIPRGANLSSSMLEDDVPIHIRSKSRRVCKLFFVAADWNRKGGNFVVEVTQTLIAMGNEVVLHVVGQQPPARYRELSWIRYEGFLKKDSVSDMNRLKHLYMDCHFFMMLSKYENFGIVFCEASAFGLPSIGYDTGGVASAVKEGRNGKLFDIETNSSKIAEYIHEAMRDSEYYLRLSFSSYDEYKNRLNWKVACANFLKFLDEI